MQNNGENKNKNRKKFDSYTFIRFIALMWI